MHLLFSIAQADRSILFPLSTNVAKETENLKQNDITGNINNEPTHWHNPLLVIIKDDEKIWLSLHMEKANCKIEKKKNSYINSLM